MNKQYSTLAAIGYALLVGFSFLITKLVLPFAPPILILAHRFTIAFVVYTLYLIITKQSIELNRKKINCYITRDSVLSTYLFFITIIRVN
jgi:drug/metabolite transporter (DMT)-like permease